MRFNRYQCVPVGVNRLESKAQSFLFVTLGDCSESKARSCAAGPGFVGRESSRFLWLETLEKPDNGINDAEHLCGSQFFERLSAPGFHPGSMKLRQKPTRRQVFGTSTATIGFADHLLLAKPSDE